MSKHQEAMYRRRTAWTLIRDAFNTAQDQAAGSPYMGAFADGLHFALLALSTRRIGKIGPLPKRGAR